MPQYDGKEVLTIGKAEQAKRAAEAWCERVGYGDAPLLFKPGRLGDHWTLVMSGDEGWASEIEQDESMTWPAGVGVDVVNGCTVSLYPKRDPDVDSQAQQLVRNWERATALGRPGDEHMAAVAMAQFLRNTHLS